tara:strand:- start:6153 stop:6425 length:273 start_codon:yes stop_codon:yes gene_type:complete
MSKTLNELIITAKLSYGEGNKILACLKFSRDNKNNELNNLDILIKDFEEMLEGARDYQINKNLDKTRPNLRQEKIENPLQEREMVCEKCE